MPAKKLVDRLFQDVWNCGKLEVLNEILSSDFILHLPSSEWHGIDPFRTTVNAWRSAFPDIHHDVDEVIEANDKVIIRWHGAGTQQGIFMGLVPNVPARKMNYSGITIFKIKDNRFTEAWVSSDVMQIMHQLAVYSDKIYTEADFSVDFNGPAKLIYRWMMNARPTPACKQKMIDALRNQFSVVPLNNEPPFIIPNEITKEVSSNEIYIPTATRQVRALVYHPKNSKNKLLPLLIYAHGGGWSIGNPEEAEFLARKIALTAEVVVLNLDYSLAPENPYPAGLDDCVAAYEWARENAQQKLNADPNKIAFGGDSSGGNLAAAVALRMRESGKRPPDALLLLCPLTDFVFEKYDSALKLGPNGLVYDFAFLSMVRSIYSPYHLWQLPFVSPMYGEYEKFPPTFILAAGQDLLFDENKAFAEKLKNANVDVELLIHEDMPHAYYYFLGMTKEEDLAYQALSKFLKRVF